MQPGPDPSPPTPSVDAAAARSRFAAVVAVLVVVLTLPRLLRHELWRDEAWQWLVSIESGSLAELFAALGRATSGYLSGALYWATARISTAPLAGQLLNLALVVAGAWVFARHAPLTRRERLLAMLGYFPFWEYAVISRDYAISMLLLWVACAAVRAERPIALGFALALLFQTKVYGWVLAVAIGLGWAFDRWSNRGQARPLPRSTAIAAAAIAALGAIAGLVQLVPPAGTPDPLPWLFSWNGRRAAFVLRGLWRGLAPMPELSVQFWNTTILDRFPTVQIVAGVLVLALAMFMLRRHRVAVVTFSLGAAGLLAFGYTKFPGVTRHNGFFWLLFLAALWLGASRVDSAPVFAGWRTWSFTTLLAVHVAAAAWASWIDLRYPFSNGPATAQLLRSAGLADELLFGHREPPVASVALPLGRPFWSPSREVFTTHPDYGPKQREMVDPEVRCAARALATRESRDVVMVMNRELPPWGELDVVGARVGSVNPSEDYHVYRLLGARLSATSAEAACQGP